jgi:2,3-bisphosphoglycerate-dependent phosphoglycerate mutase
LSVLPAPPGASKPGSFLVVRHGETAWNREGRIQGQGDSPLSERGLRQARAVAEHLARERLVALYSSDLGRARETARHLAVATGLVVRFDAGLRERAFGILEGSTWDEIGRDHPEVARALREDPAYAIPRGESLEGFRDRVLVALDRIARDVPAGPVAVVTHGGVLGVLYREAMAIPLGAPRTYTTHNAGINRFQYESGRWSVVSWADADHLVVTGSLDDP